MEEESQNSGQTPEGEESAKPYLEASLDQEKPREDRPSIVGAYVQLFAAEYGGETTEEIDGEA